MNIFTLTMVPMNPPYDDGVKNMAINIARRLGNHRFYLVSSLFGKAFDGSDNIRFFRSAFQKKGRHSMSFPQKVFVFFVIIFNMRKIDIFQFFITPQPYFSKTFRKLLKKKGKGSIQVVSSIHTLNRKNREEDIGKLFFADRVVTYSEFTKKKLEEKGVRNVTRIYPGIDTSRFSAARGETASFPAGTFSETGRNVVYPGTYSVLKDSYSFDGFCEIARRVINDREDVRFIMACRRRSGKDALLESEFRAIAEKYGIAGNFSFLNLVEDMCSLFERCDIGIMPAQKPMSGVLEIPMVLPEMGFLEKPVLYGKVPPLDELEGKGLGIMVDGGAPEDYAGRILQLMEDSGRAEEVGRRSREAVEKFFNIENMVNEYDKIYKELGR